MSAQIAPFRRIAIKADPLTTRAARLYPDAPYLQREWLRAIAVVRATSAGWLLDRAVPRVAR